MHWYEILYTPFAVVFAVVHLGLATLEQAIAYPLSFASEEQPIQEPIYHLAGPRYMSLKLDLPLTERSLWWYVGDEPKQSGGVDQQTYAFRTSKFGDTFDLRGSEDGPQCGNFERFGY